MIKIKQNLVSPSKYSIKCPNAMKAEYITLHNTYNDASAKNEISYMINNNNSTSYHIAVDDKEAIQGIPFNRNAWHCGDGNGNGNRKSIGIEICYSKSGGDRYNKAEQNAIKLTAQMLHERKWGVDRVKKHQDWSLKYCPHRILDEGRWNAVIKAIQVELDKLGNTSSTTIKQPSKPVNKPQSNPVGKVKPNYNTKSIVVFLQSINQPFSLAHRKKLASYYGIQNYTGSAVQNLMLVDLLKKDHKATGKIKTGHLNRPVDNPTTKTSTNSNTSYKGKRVESKVNGLRFYNKPSWANKDVVGRVDKGYGFPTIVSKIKVGKGYQYKVKNSKGKVYYITASEQYVRVV